MIIACRLRPGCGAGQCARPGFGCSPGWLRFGIDSDASLDIDQVVGCIGLRRPAVDWRPSRDGIRRRDRAGCSDSVQVESPTDVDRVVGRAGKPATGDRRYGLADIVGRSPASQWNSTAVDEAIIGLGRERYHVGPNDRRTHFEFE
jgi:hypothetical protein